MKIAYVIALALLAAPAAVQAQVAQAQGRGSKPAICQWRGPGNTGTAGSLTAQMDIPCVVTGTAGRRVVVTPPRNGTAAFSANGGDLRYTPRRGFVGSDEFVYANGEGAGRRLITVSVTVQREPVVAAAPQASTTPPDWPECQFSGGEIGGTNAPVEMVQTSMRTRAGSRCWFRVGVTNVTMQQDTAPSHGTVVIDGSRVTYTSVRGYSGADSFVIRWSGGGQIRRLAVIVEVR